MSILNKLTIKHLKMNPKRTIVSIIGIILSTALMVGIGLLMSTMRENMIDITKAESGTHHVVFYNLNLEQYENISKLPEIQEEQVLRELGYADTNLEDYYYDYFKIYSADSTFFQHLSLKEGKLPQNETEILIPDDKNIPYQIGDTITLEIGQRYLGDNPVEDYERYEEETLKNKETKSYQVVGIIDKNIYQPYSDVGLYFYTTRSISTYQDYTIYLNFQKMKDTYDLVDQIVQENQLSTNQVKTNDALLTLYGSSRYNNFIRSILSSLVVVLTVLSIACIIVIYNSFAISVLERKKQFGLLSSIGTTKKQIRHTVFFEAFVVGVIGIPLGILSAYFGIGCVLAIINYLLPNFFDAPLRLVTYPIFILVPVLFMIVTILISSFLPARSASRITPIEAIRLNDDIKIKGKKVKSPKWIRNIFGMEAEIAFKNMKRNKKKYRITVLSLFVSIVLFVSFSGFMKYIFSGLIDSYASLPDYDATLYVRNPDYQNTNQFMKEVRKHPDLKKSLYYHLYYDFYSSTDVSKKEYFSDSFYEFVRDSSETFEEPSIILMEIDRDSYQDILKQLGKKEEKPILYNHFETVKYENNNRKSYVISKYSSHFHPSFDLCYTDSEQEVCRYQIDDYYIEDFTFYGDEDIVDCASSIVFLIPMGYLENLDQIYNDAFVVSEMVLSIDHDDDFENSLESLGKSYSIDYYQYSNFSEDVRLTRNIVFCVKLLVYGFISLVTLIGVTSVFNTIHTSMHLRRKEFAMLRSIGLSKKGFYKTLLFESIFFGMKSILYALPVSFGVLYLLYLSFDDMTEFGKILIPYDSIWISILGVFIVIIISTFYATRKIRHENILEALREENI